MIPCECVRLLRSRFGLAVAVLGLTAGAATASEAPVKARPGADEALTRLVAGGSDVRVHRSRRTGLARFIAAQRGPGFALSSAKGATAEQRAQAFVAAHGAAFGLGQKPETKLLRVAPRDEAGLEHVRVQQLHRGIPVTGAELIVHMQGDSVRAASGHTLDVTDIGDLDVSPSVSEATAQEVAAGVVRERYGVVEPTLAAPRLEVFNRGIFDDSAAPSRLAWFVEARAPKVLEYVWVDAQDGSVLLHFSQVSRALNRKIYSQQSGTPVLVRSEGGPPVPGDADVNNLYDHWKITYDFFKTRFGRDSIDGAGQQLVGTVHDGGTGNAAWIPLSESFTFSDGCATDDVVAHEFTHGVVFHTARLFNYMESGSLNESFSDMLGETVDLTDGVGNDAPEVRWLNSEDEPVFGPIRSLMDPNLFGQPGRISDPMYSCSSDDFYGEHHNSGVSSHAYALMADGGTYNGHTVRGIGLDKAVQVAYAALTAYLPSAAGFAEASDAFQQACTDLVGRFGITSDDCAQVVQALEAVEMPDARPCHSVLVRVRKAGAGSGHVTFMRNTRDALLCEPTSVCDQYVYEGTKQQADATADPGSVFAGWRGPCPYPASPSCIIWSITGDTVDLVAVFEPVGTTHTVTVSIGTAAPGARITSGSGGIDCGTDCTEVDAAGDAVTLSATADPGYGLVRWSGACSGIGATCTFAVNGPVGSPLSVTADFGPLPYSPVQDFDGTPGLGGGATWGDYDGDGDLDLVVLTAGSSAFSTLYENAGGMLSDTGTVLPALQWSGPAAWGDFDNDGDLDLAVQGMDAASNSVLKIYRNNGGTLVDSGMTVPTLEDVATLAWIDYDNDGDLDLALGHMNDNPSKRSWILRNDHGTLVDSGISLPTAMDWQWGDYDGDGRLDLVAVHEPINGGTDFKSRLYHNDGGTLVDSGVLLDAPNAFAAAWVDYDGDGYLDLSFSSGELFHNQGGKLVKVASPLKPGPGTSITWADADANGYPDLLVFEAIGSNTALYLNQSGTFTEAAASDQPLGLYSTSAWADFDNDGHLDLFVHPEDVLYRSALGAVNTAPQPPTSTSVLQSADSVRLMWTAGSDAQTPAAGLTYNVRVGTTAFGSEIVSAMADALTGRRLVARTGNAGGNLFYILNGLAPGHYYYSVQSIDTSFAGSGYTSGSFDFPPAVTTTVTMTSDSGTSYCADLTVTNISSSTVTGWQSGFALPGGSSATITSLTNFQYTPEGAIVSLKPRWFNRTLTAGQSVTGRVCANGSSGATYLLQVAKNGLGNGYVSANPIGIECGSDCSESYPGGTVTLTATPAYGSRFLRWDGACSGSATTCTVTMGPGGASVTAWFMPDTTGGVTVTPVVVTSQPYYNEEDVRITNPASITALSVTIVIQRTTGITYNGQFNTVGSQIQQSHTTAASTITYRFALTPGQTVSPGTWSFAAQTNGTGTAHPTSGDTYTVTYTTGGQTYTQSGHF